MPKTEASRTFGVSLSSVKRYCRLAAREEPLVPTQVPQGWRKAPGDERRRRSAARGECGQAPLLSRSRARRLPPRSERGGTVGTVVGPGNGEVGVAVVQEAFGGIEGASGL